MIYVLLIPIYPSYGNVKRYGSLMLLDKSRLMLALVFSFTFSHLTFITHTSHHNSTLIHIHLSLTSSHTYRYTHSCSVTCHSGEDIENGSHFHLSTVKQGPKARGARRVSIRAHTLRLCKSVIKET